MTEMEKGWYVNPSNLRRERYWDGEKWMGNRKREAATPYVPGQEHEPGHGMPVVAKTTNSWATAAGWMYFIAALAVIGAAAGGIALLVTKGRTCTSNPYSAIYGDSTPDCVDTHPFTAAGLGVLIGGLLQAAVIFTVAALCRRAAAIHAHGRSAP